jgi:hypothetical protein
MPSTVNFKYGYGLAHLAGELTATQLPQSSVVYPNNTVPPFPSLSSTVTKNLIHVFPEMKLYCHLPNSYVPCICDGFIYSQDRSAYNLPVAK